MGTCQYLLFCDRLIARPVMNQQFNSIAFLCNLYVLFHELHGFLRDLLTSSGMSLVRIYEIMSILVILKTMYKTRKLTV
jgi:hypothetical protein